MLALTTTIATGTGASSGHTQLQSNHAEWLLLLQQNSFQTKKHILQNPLNNPRPLQHHLHPLVTTIKQLPYHFLLHHQIYIYFALIPVGDHLIHTIYEGQSWRWGWKINHNVDLHDLWCLFFICAPNISSIPFPLNPVPPTILLFFHNPHPLVTQCPVKLVPSKATCLHICWIGTWYLTPAAHNAVRTERQACAPQLSQRCSSRTNEDEDMIDWYNKNRTLL